MFSNVNSDFTSKTIQNLFLIQFILYLYDCSFETYTAYFALLRKQIYYLRGANDVSFQCLKNIYLSTNTGDTMINELNFAFEFARKSLS